MNKKIWAAIFVVLAIFGLKKCTDHWTGIVYPDKSTLSNFKNIGEFNSLEQCKNEAINVLRRISSQSSGDFECGLNCKGSICEKTSR
jgi:hypothetical protein